MLDLFQQDEDVDTSSTDSVGFSAMESDVQSMTIAMAYIDFAKSEAASVNIIFKNAAGNELRITEYISSGKAKGCKTFYVNKNGKKVALPGWAKINDLCIAATGEGFGKQTAEEKTIEIYDYEAKAKLPQKRKVIMSLIKETVKVGVLKVIEDKKEKNAAGEYIPTGETRTVNEADKFFNADTDFTPAELSAKATEPKFINTWLKRWEGKTKDTSTKTEAKAGAPTGSGTPSTASLFPV